MSTLTDQLGDTEIEVLKQVPGWPFGKVECMVIAWKRHQGLSDLLNKIRRWPHAAMEAPAELNQLGRAMDAIISRLDPLRRTREQDAAKFKAAGVYYDEKTPKMVQQSTVILARRACTLALSLVGRWGTDKVGTVAMPGIVSRLLLDAAQFSFRVYQCAEGFDKNTKELFTQVNDYVQKENQRKAADEAAAAQEAAPK
eukprot:TRINITY_DN10370_c0_g1_i1.p2 TRINITY_DN10370_c0_g1~~TRINITY_DN10370_c0_g1_i1.p2  ORF type:complete len:198 (-),score=79.63 TRINITY_DN10370_c0_g1_i1:393-986(-)